jgi:hypothetical protein
VSKLETNVAPGHTLEIPFVAYSLGTLMYRIFADEKVDTFVLDPLARDVYKAGRTPMTLAVTEQEKMHVGQAQLPYGGQWFVLVRNRTDKQVRVQAELEFLPTAQGTGVDAAYRGIFGSR